MLPLHRSRCNGLDCARLNGVDAHPRLADERPLGRDTGLSALKVFDVMPRSVFAARVLGGLDLSVSPPG